MFSFVHKIVLFGAFPRAKNRALDRAFWCSPSCTKSCFLALSLVKNRALDRVFLCSPSCQKWCSRSCLLLQLLGLCQYIWYMYIYTVCLVVNPYYIYIHIYSILYNTQHLSVCRHVHHQNVPVMTPLLSKL